MGKRGYSREKIVAKLREAELLLTIDSIPVVTRERTMNMPDKFRRIPG